MRLAPTPPKQGGLGHTPEFDGLIAAGADQFTAVGAQRQREDPFFVGLAPDLKTAPAVQVPEPDGVIFAATD